MNPLRILGRFEIAFRDACAIGVYDMHLNKFLRVVFLSEIFHHTSNNCSDACLGDVHTSLYIVPEEMIHHALNACTPALLVPYLLSSWCVAPSNILVF
jgi:hypothetical protein